MCAGRSKSQPGPVISVHRVAEIERGPFDVACSSCDVVPIETDSELKRFHCHPPLWPRVIDVDRGHCVMATATGERDDESQFSGNSDRFLLLCLIITITNNH